MVCYCVIAAPCERSVGCVFAHLNTLVNDSETPWTMSCLYNTKCFPQTPTSNPYLRSYTSKPSIRNTVPTLTQSPTATPTQIPKLQNYSDPYLWPLLKPAPPTLLSSPLLPLTEPPPPNSKTTQIPTSGPY